MIEMRAPVLPGCSDCERARPVVGCTPASATISFFLRIGDEAALRIFALDSLVMSPCKELPAG